MDFHGNWRQVFPSWATNHQFSAPNTSVKDNSSKAGTFLPVTQSKNKEPWLHANKRKTHAITLCFNISFIGKTFLYHFLPMVNHTYMLES